VSRAEAGIDEGWQELEAGNLAAARRAAQVELRDDPEDPDALVLLAACHREQGDFDEALSVLSRAADAAPEWSEPPYVMADILAYELDRPTDALRHAALALDRAEEEDEFLDAILLKAGLEIELDKLGAAQATLAELPPAEEVTLPADVALDLAYLFFEARLRVEAEHRFALLTQEHGEDAEAWYGLGLCAEERGDEAAKRTAWSRALERDRKSPLQSPHMSEAQMAEVAEQALKELPDTARRLIMNVPILIVDLPAADEVEHGLDPRLLGLFAGTPYDEVSSVGGAPQLTQILLFRKNLERMAIDREDLREQIRITLLHETGHFFGMSEKDLADVGLD
jgi:predicted Zn-dependent protease with MMP-like domain/Flp pilus assembly protein TadD